MTAPLRALASAITTCLDAAKRALASANTADQQAKAAAKAAQEAEGVADTVRVLASGAGTAEATATTQADVATTQAGVATTQAGVAVTSAAAAAVSRAQAQAAYVAALAAQNVGVVGFSDKSTMDASLTFADGVVALVTNDASPTNNAYYRKSGASGGGSWVKQSAGDLALVKQRTEGGTQAFLEPNLWSDDTYVKSVAAAGGAGDASGIYAKFAGASVSAATAPNGRAGFRVTWSATGQWTWNNTLANLGFVTGGKFSFCCRALAGGTATGGVGTVRLLVRQLKADSSEITASRQTYSFPVGAVAADTDIAFAGVLIDPLCNQIQVYIDAGAAGCDLTFTGFMVATGSVSQFRPSPAAYVDARAAAVAQGIVNSLGAANKTDITRALAPLFIRPNVVSNDWASTILLGNAGPIRSASTFENRPAVLCDNTAGEWFIDFPRTNFPSGFAVAGARLCARTFASGGRILIFQVNAGNAEIAGTRVTLTAAAGASLPATLSGVAALDPACVTVRLFISGLGGSAGNTVTWQDVYLANGQEQVYRPSVGAASSASLGAVISASGNDVSGTGTVGQPFATLDRAISAVGGNGVVYVSDAGGAFGPMVITPANVTGRVEIRGVRSSLAAGAYSFPLIRLAAKVTGITKTAGQSKVYQANVAGLPTLANFNWAYQDGVADPRTAIADADREPQHRGRTSRLQNFARIIKTTATTLAGALAEIDAGLLPLGFVDTANGVFYFSVVGGGDATGASIYFDAATGLVANATQGSSGTLNITGLEVRYGGVNLRPFKSAHLDEVVVAGSRVNAVDYNVLTFGTLEVCCAGSQDQFNGDGLNGHNGARLEWGMDLYSHDCWDDGFSDHEGCSSRLHGGLIEYSGGSAVIPAYGSDNVTRNVVSRRNQQRPGWKPSAFHALGAPLEGYDTRAMFVNCVDIESTQSFGDDLSGAATRAVAVNCKAIRPVNRGYSCYSVRDCGYIASGTSTMRNAATLVENTIGVT